MSAHEFDAHADIYRQTLDDALAIGGGDSLYTPSESSQRCGRLWPSAHALHQWIS